MIHQALHAATPRRCRAAGEFLPVAGPCVLQTLSRCVRSTETNSVDVRNKAGDVGRDESVWKDLILIYRQQGKESKLTLGFL